MIKLLEHSKTCIKRPLPKRPKIGFQDQLSLNAGQKYCRMLQVKHSATLLTCIKLPFCLFVLFDSLCPSQQFFSYVGMGLPGLKQYEARIIVSCSRTQHSYASEVRTLGLELSTLPLSCCATLSYHLSLRSTFCLFLSGRFTQALPHFQDTD